MLQENQGLCPVVLKDSSMSQKCQGCTVYGPFLEDSSLMAGEIYNICGQVERMSHDHESLPASTQQHASLIRQVMTMVLCCVVLRR